MRDEHNERNNSEKNIQDSHVLVNSDFEAKIEMSVFVGMDLIVGSLSFRFPGTILELKRESLNTFRLSTTGALEIFVVNLILFKEFRKVHS